MALFLSKFTNLMGQNGRVSMPATFRAQLKSLNATQAVVLYRSFTNNCIEGCTTERMNQLSDASDTLDAFSQNQDSINSLIFADAHLIPIDSAGRITIPAEFMDYAQIKKDALFVGVGKTFQIWEPLNFEKHQKQLRLNAQKIRPTLKIS